MRIWQHRSTALVLLLALTLSVPARAEEPAAAAQALGEKNSGNKSNGRNSQASNILAGASAMAGMSCVELMRQASKEEDPEMKRWLRMMAMQQCSQASQFALGSQKNSDSQKSDEKKETKNSEDELKKFAPSSLKTPADVPEAPIDKRLLMVETDLQEAARGSVSEVESLVPAAPLNMEDIKSALSTPVRTKGETVAETTAPKQMPDVSSSRTTLSAIERKEKEPTKPEDPPARGVASVPPSVASGAKPTIGMNANLDPVTTVENASPSAANSNFSAVGGSKSSDGGGDETPGTAAPGQMDWKALFAAASEARGFNTDGKYLEFKAPEEGEKRVTIFDYVRFRYEYAAFKEKRVRIPQRRPTKIVPQRFVQSPALLPRTMSAKMPPY